jgi:hypothetical protein
MALLEEVGPVRGGALWEVLRSLEHAIELWDLSPFLSLSFAPWLVM